MNLAPVVVTISPTSDGCIQKKKKKKKKKKNRVGTCPPQKSRENMIANLTT